MRFYFLHSLRIGSIYLNPVWCRTQQLFTFTLLQRVARRKMLSDLDSYRFRRTLNVKKNVQAKQWQQEEEQKNPSGN